MILLKILPLILLLICVGNGIRLCLTDTYKPKWDECVIIFFGGFALAAFYCVGVGVVVGGFIGSFYILFH